MASGYGFFTPPSPRPPGAQTVFKPEEPPDAEAKIQAALEAAGGGVARIEQETIRALCGTASGGHAEGHGFLLVEGRHAGYLWRDNYAAKVQKERMPAYLRCFMWALRCAQENDTSDRFSDVWTIALNLHDAGLPQAVPSGPPAIPLDGVRGACQQSPLQCWTENLGIFVGLGDQAGFVWHNNQVVPVPAVLVPSMITVSNLLRPPAPANKTDEGAPLPPIHLSALAGAWEMLGHLHAHPHEVLKADQLQAILRDKVLAFMPESGVAKDVHLQMIDDAIVNACLALRLCANSIGSHLVSDGVETFCWAPPAAQAPIAPSHFIPYRIPSRLSPTTAPPHAGNPPGIGSTSGSDAAPNHRAS